MSNMESDGESISSNDLNPIINSPEISANIKDEQRLKIREEMSTLSFEDLLKMKEKMGSKIYNETVFGVSKKKMIKGVKRANKNRPREVSSKIRPKKLKKELNPNNLPLVKKTAPRDPRFDPLCGKFEEKIFKSNYRFVNNIRTKEKNTLEKELKSCADPQQKQTIKLLIQRMNNQIREQERKDKEDINTYDEKRTVREKLKKGEKPVFKKKSVKKIENLIQKYEELKKSNKLQKHIEKRTKKLLSRDKRKMIDYDLL